MHAGMHSHTPAACPKPRAAPHTYPHDTGPAGPNGDVEHPRRGGGREGNGAHQHTPQHGRQTAAQRQDATRDAVHVAAQAHNRGAWPRHEARHERSNLKAPDMKPPSTWVHPGRKLPPSPHASHAHTTIRPTPSGFIELSRALVRFQLGQRGQHRQLDRFHHLRHRRREHAAGRCRGVALQTD